MINSERNDHLAHANKKIDNQYDEKLTTNMTKKMNKIFEMSSGRIVVISKSKYVMC